MAYLKFSTPFIRPNDSTDYAAGDLVANHATAGSVVVPGVDLPDIGSAIRITGGLLRKSAAGVVNADFAVHIFSGALTPVPTVGDNGALNASQVMASTGGADYRGRLIGAKANFRSWTGGNVCPLVPEILTIGGIIVDSSPTGRTLKFLIEALAAYDPGALETFEFAPLWEPILGAPGT